MADRTDRRPPARRRSPDPVTLVAGLLTLLMAGAAFTGTVPDVGGVDLRWLLAVGAVGVGVVLLVGSLRGRPRR